MENAEHELAFDAIRRQVGTIYAKALLGVTEKRGVTERAMDELESFIRDVLERLPKFEAVLSAPRVAIEEKQRLLDRAVGKTMQKDLLIFLKVTARHGRLDCLREILAEAKSRLDALRGRVEVLVESATPLDDAARDAVRARLRESLGAEVVLKVVVNPEIVGGLVVRVGDTVYDASVANRLERLRQSVLATARRSLRVSADRFAST
ncbi:MAG: ATP synthase F1 subunit delta [Planctomycetes bacterium]|nr:ATP synthase F1 subunit delta [Planctomycetota bacterium]